MFPMKNAESALESSLEGRKSSTVSAVAIVESKKLHHALILIPHSLWGCYSKGIENEVVKLKTTTNRWASMSHRVP